MQIHPIITRLASGSVYLFAFAVAIYAIVSPYMETTPFGGLKISVYLEKECANNICGNLPSSEFKNQGKALYALYVVFVILAGLAFILLLLNQRTYYNALGFLLLGVALATLITLIVVIKTSYSEMATAQYNYEMTTASILMIIACCFMIVKQMYSNDVIRPVIKKILHHK